MNKVIQSLPAESIVGASHLLVLHAVGVALQVVMCLILVRALWMVGRDRAIPRGFLPIAVLISLTTLGRGIRLLYTWLAPPPPLWLLALTLAMLFLTIVAIPLILASVYLRDAAAGSARRLWSSSLRAAMLVNAVGAPLAISAAVVFQAWTIISLISCIAFFISAVLLTLLTAANADREARSRAIVMFVVLTVAGLLALSVDIFLVFSVMRGGIRFAHPIRALQLSAACREIGNLLIMLGMVFVFSRLRLADVVIKRVLRVYVWGIMALVAWLGTEFAHTLSHGRIVHDAGLSLIAVGLVASAIWITPRLADRIDVWVDRWIFELPSFDQALLEFFRRSQTVHDMVLLHRAAEDSIHRALSLAAVRVVPLAELCSAGAPLPELAPIPHFLTLSESVRSALEPHPDVLVPLAHEGNVNHWIALTQGSSRPPLTSGELTFVERIASHTQTRADAIKAQLHGIEEARREAMFREDLANAELRALRAQINPHFLFNALNTIADLCIEQPESAETMTLRLAAVFRYLLVNSDRLFVSLEEELEFARSYLAVEEARFGERLKSRFDIAPEVLNTRVPTLLLQPLIENAIKHGISPAARGGMVEVIARNAGTALEIVVSDDGAGLNRGRLASPERSTRVGISNVRRRLGSAYGEGASLQLTARENGGASAIIRIPNGGRSHEGHIGGR